MGLLAWRQASLLARFENQKKKRFAYFQKRSELLFWKPARISLFFWFIRTSGGIYEFIFFDSKCLYLSVYQIFKLLKFSADFLLFPIFSPKPSLFRHLKMAVHLRSRKLKSGDRSLYLDIHHHGDRWREFLKIRISPKDSDRTEKKRIAERIRANRELELLSQSTGHIPSHLTNLNFFDFAENYLSNYPFKDVRIVHNAVQKFKVALGNTRLTFAQITPKVMEAFKDYLIHESGLTRETAHNYFTRFKKILKAAKIKGYLREMPTADIRFANPNKDDTIRKQVLDTKELQILATTHCGNSEVKRAFLFACYTSLGLAEIKLLKWSNINKGRLITYRNKTGEIINNRLNPTALIILGEPKGRNEFVFQLQKLSNNGVNKAIEYWVKRAGIQKHITFYCARHTFACQLLIHGANLKTVADAMGHSSTQSTLKYLNYVQKLQDEAIDKLPVLQID